MRRLKRRDCAVLHLGLKWPWYHLIDNGTKHVEFREATPYWNTRIENWTRRTNEGRTPVLEFQNGYGKFSPRMWFIAGSGVGITHTFSGADVPVQHKELGEFPKARYTLFIGERVELEDW